VQAGQEDVGSRRVAEPGQRLAWLAAHDHRDHAGYSPGQLSQPPDGPARRRGEALEALDEGHRIEPRGSLEDLVVRIEVHAPRVPDEVCELDGERPDVLDALE